MNARLTHHELDLLRTLTRRVRLLSFRQLAAGWWPGIRHRRGMRNQLCRLEAAGLIEVHVINAHPQLPVNRPLFAWQPGGDEPPAERIATAARARWKRAAVPTWVCVASPLAANLFGSTARSLPALEHRDHDLRLSAVYVHYRRRQPELARTWVGEHARSKAGYRVKDPDALLIGRRRQILRVIEAVGRYHSEHVEAFHEHCVECNLPYELW